MKKSLISFFAMFLSFYALTASATPCALEEEKTALDVRALQTQLMVSALSCGNQKEYNAFIKRFKAQLAKHGNNLEHYFDRVYSEAGQQKQNNFITRLANISSEVSLDEDEDEYCNKVADLFDDVFDTKPAEIYKVARNSGADDLHGISSCR